MITVRIATGDFVVEIETDAELHPDLLDEITTRACRLFLSTQAGLPEDVESTQDPGDG